MTADLTPDALGHPLEFPPEFKRWLADYVATQVPKLPISQVFGYQLQRVRTAVVDTQQTTTSTSYTDLATTGPTLSQLANGFYLLVFGGDCSNASSAGDGYMAPSINGVAAADADGVLFSGTFNDSTAINSNLRVLLVQLDTPGGNNEIVMKYRVTSGTGYFNMRFLHAIKVISTDV